MGSVIPTMPSTLTHSNKQTVGQLNAHRLGSAAHEHLWLLSFRAWSEAERAHLFLAICVRAQTEGVRKQGQSPEARTMKVNHSILLHRTGCYHFPLSNTYTLVWFVHHACAASLGYPTYVLWVASCRSRVESRAFCVWRDLPRFRPWLVL